MQGPASENQPWDSFLIKTKQKEEEKKKYISNILAVKSFFKKADIVPIIPSEHCVHAI